MASILKRPDLGKNESTCTGLVSGRGDLFSAPDSIAADLSPLLSIGEADYDFDTGDLIVRTSIMDAPAILWRRRAGYWRASSEDAAQGLRVKPDTMETALRRGLERLSGLVDKLRERGRDVSALQEILDEYAGDKLSHPSNPSESLPEKTPDKLSGVLYGPKPARGPAPFLHRSVRIFRAASTIRGSDEADVIGWIGADMLDQAFTAALDRQVSVLSAQVRKAREATAVARALEGVANDAARVAVEDKHEAQRVAGEERSRANRERGKRLDAVNELARVKRKAKADPVRSNNHLFEDWRTPVPIQRRPN